MGVGPAAVVVDYRQCVRRAAFEQFRRRVQPLWILQFGQVEAELGQQLRRRQAVANERVVGHPNPPRNGEGDHSPKSEWWRGPTEFADLDRGPPPPRCSASRSPSPSRGGFGNAAILPAPPPSPRSRPWPRARPGGRPRPAPSLGNDDR